MNKRMTRISEVIGFRCVSVCKCECLCVHGRNQPEEFRNIFYTYASVCWGGGGGCKIFCFAVTACELHFANKVQYSVECLQQICLVLVCSTAVTLPSNPNSHCPVLIFLSVSFLILVH